MNNPRLLGTCHLAALSALLLAGACSVDAHLPQVEVTQHDVSFEGIPFLDGQTEAALSHTFTQRPPRLDIPKDLFSEVRALNVELTAKSGVPDLSFIRYLRVTVAPVGVSGEAAAPIEVIDYTRPEGVTIGSTLSLPCPKTPDVLEAWKADKVSFTVDLAGTLPAARWSTDVKVRYAGKVKYER